MLSRFYLWQNLLRIRLRLLGILACQLFLTDPWVIFATTVLPFCYGLLWFLTRDHYRTLTCLYGGLLLGRFLYCLFASHETAPLDPPILESLQKYPRLDELAQTVRADFRRSRVQDVAFVLSPIPWRSLGCSAAHLQRNTRAAVIPIGCLGIYSIFDLKCEWAHALHRPRSRVVIPACAANCQDLKQLTQPLVLQSRPPWQTRAVLWLRAAYYRNLGRWNLLADLQADGKVASQYGAFAVSNWIQRSQLARHSVAACVAHQIVPFAQDGVLLPVVETCRTYHHLWESPWLSLISRNMAAQERKPGAMSHLLFRLGALQHGLQNARGMDPRSAATLVDDLSSLEELVARHEIELPSDLVLQKPAIDELATAVFIPLMQKELNRNATLISTWTLADLPDLVRSKKAMADVYHPNPRLALARTQREALIPRLFTSFLTMELIKLGWLPSLSAEHGFTLTLGQTVLHPARLIQDLSEGKLDQKTFLRLIQSD